MTGTVSASGYDVYVNGVKATVSGDPTWSAPNVPLLDNQGSGKLLVSVYPSGSNPNTNPPTASPAGARCHAVGGAGSGLQGTIRCAR